jgi:hypothetical protein
VGTRRLRLWSGRRVCEATIVLARFDPGRRFTRQGILAEGSIATGVGLATLDSFHLNRNRIRCSWIVEIKGDQGQLPRPSLTTPRTCNQQKPQQSACQAPKPPNPLPINSIRLAYELGPNRYTVYRDKENTGVQSQKNPDKPPAVLSSEQRLYRKAFRSNILQVNHLLSIFCRHSLLLSQSSILLPLQTTEYKDFTPKIPLTVGRGVLHNKKTDEPFRVAVRSGIPPSSTPEVSIFMHLEFPSPKSPGVVADNRSPAPIQQRFRARFRLGMVSLRSESQLAGLLAIAPRESRQPVLPAD